MSTNPSRPQHQEVDISAFQTTNSYPFPTLWSAKDDTSSLVRLLPPEPDLFFYLESFQRRSILFSFPMVPDEVAAIEVRRFLQNLENNAALYPDYLALLFATLALGLHDGVFDKLGEKWAVGSMETESKKGAVYGWYSSPRPPRNITDPGSRCRYAMSPIGIFHESSNYACHPSVGHDGAVSYL